MGDAAWEVCVRNNEYFTINDCLNSVVLIRSEKNIFDNNAFDIVAADGSLCRQGTSSNGIDLVLLEYSGLSNRGA